MQAVASKWVISYNLLKNWVYWGENPFSNHLPSLWDIQVDRNYPMNTLFDDTSSKSTFPGFFFGGQDSFVARSGPGVSNVGFRGCLLRRSTQRNPAYVGYILPGTLT